MYLFPLCSLALKLMQEGRNAFIKKEAEQNIQHTFDKSNKYSFIENKTDNIMDYSPINSNKSLKATYKWQWEEVHKVAEEIRYLENEINKQ